MRIDPFFEKQPPIKFIENLKRPVHETPPPNFGHGKPQSGEISSHGFYIREKYPDPYGLLETSYADFEVFGKVSGAWGESYPIDLVYGKVNGTESYRIETSDTHTTVTAEDTEGIRRAIVYLEDEMTAREGAILPLGVKERSPHLLSRITRGFFSPTNRAPKWGDELLDDIEYYPDEYLNRLVHSGTNGLWIYTSFRALVSTSFFPEDDPENINKRIKKLTRVVAKCKKYGVKVYVFAIEPMGLLDDEAMRHPEFRGAAKADIRHPICLRSEAGRAYIIEATEKLFRQVPDLAGYIDITAGERPTSCGSVATYKLCPRCSKYSRGENLAYSCDMIKEGIRRAGTGAEFISWTYGHRYWNYEDIDEYIEKVPDDIILMQNFEDRGYNEQLGKPRIAFDYWLSYTGPSELYEKSVVTAKRFNKKMYAKMQVCTSHELATVPYIPAPGLIFDKYKSAHALGVSGVMECWYFGNYPSVMSRASGELAFTRDFSDKDEFLKYFATRIYGKTVGEAIFTAWRHFEEGYVSYPTNIMFSYYGPMHDGVVWELSLIPKNNALSRSWLLLDPPDGDRIGESLFAGHTLDEALILAERMKSCWQRGIEALPESGADECVSVSKGIGLLFDSGYNILKFYKLRGDLGRERGNVSDILSEMRELVKKELKNSADMITLCECDSRLGYHSEAEGFKFFPEKLRDRIAKLNKLLDVEFSRVESRIKCGKHPLAYYFAEGEEAYVIGEWQTIDSSRAFRLTVEGDELKLEVRTKEASECSVYYEFEPGIPECGVIFGKQNSGTVHPECVDVHTSNVRLDHGAMSHQSAVGAQGEYELSLYRCSESVREDGFITTLYRKIPADKWSGTGAFKMKIVIDGVSWISSQDPVRTLGKQCQSPDEYGFVISK